MWQLYGMKSCIFCSPIGQSPEYFQLSWEEDLDTMYLSGVRFYKSACDEVLCNTVPHEKKL